MKMTRLSLIITAAALVSTGAAQAQEIVDDFGPRSPNAVILPAWTVSAIACVPQGARPSYAQGYYNRDNGFYVAWDGIARERASFLAWMKANVLERQSGDCSEARVAGVRA